MKGMLVLTVLAAVTAAALGAPGSSPRQARWFLSRADVTEVVTEEKMVTQVTPWSCVVVAPSLPPCRHVRQLDIMATPPTPIAATAAPVLPRFYADNLVEAARRRYYLEQASPLDASYYGDMVPVPAAPQGGWVPLMAREATDPLPAAAPAAPVATAPAAAAPTEATAAPPSGDAAAAAVPAVPDKKREQGWAEWLGLRAYTTTSTSVIYATTKVVDPDTVVTFSVRGCQPSKLPFDLPLCVAQQPAQPAQAAPESSAPAVEVGPASASAAPADDKPAPEETKPAPAPAPTAAEKPTPEAAPAAPVAAAESAPAAPTMAPIVVAADKPTEAAAAAAPAAEETTQAKP